MPNRVCVEVCVESVEHARAAERGRADRIELCTDLSSGGITPSFGFMHTVRRHVQIPIYALIRPHSRDFCYSDHEFEIMHDDIVAARESGMNGIVLGILCRDARIDIARTRTLVDLAHPLPVTFHRAFDESANAESALEEVIQTGASRILTSAGKSAATDGLPTLARLIQAAQNRIVIMPCGGINDGNALRIIQETSAREIHTSLGGSNSSTHWGARPAGDGGSSDKLTSGEFATVLEHRVNKLVGVIRDIYRSDPVR
ncbi:MAG TPA: copper homeostasis protein CutC [Candidatus Sulfotelmatobacter sp.]|jgi:copper homeostasis protein